MTEPAELPEPAAADTSWHPLPPRGALFAAVGSGLATALPFTVAGAVLAHLLDYPHWLLAAVASTAAGLLLGAWLGWRRHRLTFWQLDSQALGVRRGHMWQNESHVPISRVQHLDLQRGPLQRMAGLSTLIVHTAGTRMNTVSIAGLDQADAERLRDQLANQLDHDDAL